MDRPHRVMISPHTHIAASEVNGDTVVTVDTEQ
jgi:hypothetical protein